MNHELHLAAEHGDVARIRALIEPGHPVNTSDEMGMTPPHHAVDDQRIGAIRLLIANGGFREILMLRAVVCRHAKTELRDGHGYP